MLFVQFCNSIVPDRLKMGCCLLILSFMNPVWGDTVETTTQAESSAESSEHDHSHDHTAGIPKEPEKRRDWLIQEYQVRQKTLAELSEQPIQPPQVEDRAFFLTTNVEHGILHPQMSGEKTRRFLVGELYLVNNTDEPVILKREDIELKLGDEKPLPQSPITEQLNGRVFQVENTRTMSLGSIKRPDQIIVEAKTTGAMWFYFDDLSTAAILPEPTLVLRLNGKPFTLNLYDQVRGHLRLRRERIGPKGALGLLKIGGRVNIFGLSILVKELDQFLEENVSRSILIWDDSVQEIDSSVMRSLYEAARQISQKEQNRRQNNELPTVPQQLQELHLVHTPGHNYSSSQPRVTHDQPITAVAASLSSLLSFTPKDELLQQIKSGHPWVRPVALSAGAASLSPKDLPLVLELSQQSENQNLQKAAVDALSEFGEARAIDRLLELAESSHETLTPLAIAGLTQSRYENGRSALNHLVNSAKGENRSRILKVISKYPSPEFAELYFENALDPESEIRVDSLKALHIVGHDNFSELLHRSLNDSDESVRDAAFEIALDQKIPELEPLLASRVLEHVKQGDLSSNIQSYLRSTKLPQTVPLLMNRLEDNYENQEERQKLIPLLTALGDERIEPLFAKIYPTLEGYEKRQLLEALGQIQSPKFLEYAREAIQEKETSLLYTAINMLSKLDSREAEQILIDGLDEVQSESYFDNLANAIAQIGSPEAEEALRKKRNSSNPKMRQAAIGGLRYLERRKPSYQYLSQARYRMRQKKWEDALEYIKISLEIDSQLATAHSLKGDVLLKLKKVEEADQAYQDALTADNDCGEAVVGRLRIQARKGKLQESLDAVAKAVPRFHQDPEFEVQTGLLYADAVNLTLNRDPDEIEDPTEEDETPDAITNDTPQEDALSEETQKQIDFWSKECLSWISSGVLHGYSDRNLLRSLPELEQFANHPDYQKALNGQLPVRKLEETNPKEAQQTGSTQTTQEGDFVILQVGGEIGDGDKVVSDLPPPPAR